MSSEKTESDQAAITALCVRIALTGAYQLSACLAHDMAAHYEIGSEAWTACRLLEVKYRAASER